MVKQSPVVLHVTAPAAFGGLERVVAGLAQGQHRRGYGVHVLAFLDAPQVDHPLLSQLRAAGVPVTGVPLPPRAYGRERAGLRAAAAAAGATLIHTHGTRVDVVDSPAARRLGLPTVTTLHGFTGGDWKNRLYEWLQIRAARRCDAVVAVSRPIQTRLRAAGLAGGRVHLVPNAWVPTGDPAFDRAEARRWLGVPVEGARVGWVGRLTPEKGADVLLDAMALLGNVPIAASFLGSGPEAERLRARAAAHGLASRVTWHGAVPDADRVMAGFDVFVLSSHTEGTPIVLFEAIAAGVPVVTTAVGGVPDVVGDAEARMVPPGRPDLLAGAIRDALADPAASRARVDAARARVGRDFAVDPWLDAYDRVYAAAAWGGRDA